MHRLQRHPSLAFPSSHCISNFTELLQDRPVLATVPTKPTDQPHH